MQVLWLGKPDVAVTWEPVSSLPTAVIAEFEQGIQTEAVQHVADCNGQWVSTLGVAYTGDQGDTTKQPRIDRPVIGKTTGWVSV